MKIKYINLRAKIEVNKQPTLLIFKLLTTVTTGLLFMFWVIFMTGNFYPRMDNSFAEKIASIPFDILIWLVALPLLLIVILPVWMTHSWKILVVTFFLTTTFFILNTITLIGLHINTFWIFWFLTTFFGFFIILTTYFFIFLLK